MKLTKLVVALLGSLLIAQAHAAPANLAERWSTLRSEQPKLQIRDAARTLGVSEADLLATKLGSGVTRLLADGNNPREIMRRALDLGLVLATTRNENGVIERTGTASRLKQPEPAPTGDKDKDAEREARMRNIAGGYLGGEIDLRFHFADWTYAFAVTQAGRDGKPARSLQFFDSHGTSVHKVFLRNDAGIAPFDKLVADFRAPQQEADLKVAAAAPAVPEKADAQVDLKEFQLAWTEMTDVHQFARILREFGLSREQALRLAPAGAAERIAPQAVRKLLDDAAKQQVAIMVFLGNEGLTQIFSGKINKTAEGGGFYNVLDPEFNLHLRDSAFTSGWVVKRGGVTSVEFFDKTGEQVVSFFGVRERGQPQPQAWDDLAASLPRAAK
ncbi:hemin-degrading factor [Janthinobacterium agaricidamnosum]|uniref:Haemin-degrading family protein n=1 Tax=Janthinobacterium agaricidamnosum NBRC 102515 = DSM 9628 TaxID=1349767 RepID=W0V5U7_9BURK|nr:hemin-degrading factor [Janthinobacterium agaricidamnosum]CDG82945.1 haemin-degrading family protein [Janthinobacterium agaricidamnosum NBRC 102515 = DSM 9628]